MAAEAYFVSEDGSRGAYLHLENRPLPEAKDELEGLWGQPVIGVSGRRRVQAAVRSPGPPDLEG